MFTFWSFDRSEGISIQYLLMSVTVPAAAAGRAYKYGGELVWPAEGNPV